MKKYFYLAAVSAMMLTACSSDKDVLEPTPKPSTPTVVAQQQAVAFDTYLSGTTASTRAGDPTGVMTTEKLKTLDKGFGVFAMFQNNNVYAANSFKPDFMYNEHVSWASGWTYSPLKYWPNETTKDSQTTPATATELDKLSFFAYAPYVNPTTAGTMDVDITGASAVTKAASIFTTAQTEGIISLSSNTLTNDPLVEWASTINLDNNVDLLWGVAPKGMDYTAVNGTAVNPVFGKPLLNLVKPDKDQKIKFLFQHALSRIGLSVVSAIDQIAAGDDGGKFNPDQTRVLIEEVDIYGDFCTRGVLNLNNSDANVANWIQASIVKSGSDAANPLITLDQGATAGTTNGYIAPDLRYVSGQISPVTGTASSGVYSGGDAAAFANINRGVLPSEQSLLSGDEDPSKKETTAPTYAYGKVYYVSNGDPAGKSYRIAKATTPGTTKVYSKDDKGNYYKVSNGSFKVDGTTQYFTLSGETGIDASTTNLTAPATGTKDYWVADAVDANKFIKKTISAGATAISTGTYYLFTGEAAVTATYEAAAGGYYSALIPRYFMFIPSKTGESTAIGVKIKYHVVTKDTKLNGNISDVSNTITKETSVKLESGKSYNLKLILGLTSVKLDATVADWQVGDDAEIWVPQNN